MYSKTNIAKLSKAQILKLLKGHRVRIKSGSGHEISLSKEQHKKLTRAHKKGMGSTLQFDPYQIDMNYEPLRGKANPKKMGEGIFDIAKSVGKSVAPALIDLASNELKKKIEGSGKKRKKACGKCKTGGNKIVNTFKDIANSIQPFVPIAKEIVPLIRGGKGYKSPRAGPKSKRLLKNVNGGALLPAGM